MMDPLKPAWLVRARNGAQWVAMILVSSLFVAAFLSGLEASLGAGL